MTGGYGPPPGQPPYGYGPPPGGYAPPPGPPPGWPPGGGGEGVARLSTFTERNPVMVLVLSIVTCGVYYLVWKFQTTDEIRIASGDESIKPGMDLLLTFLTCGLWSIYVSYRNAKKAFELSQFYGAGRSDQSTIVLVVCLIGAAFIAPIILQGEYNALGAMGRGQMYRR